MNEQTDFTIDGKLKFNLVYSVTGTLTWPNTFDDVHDVLYLSIYIINNFYSTLVNSHQPIDIQGADVSDLFDYGNICNTVCDSSLEYIKVDWSTNGMNVYGTLRSAYVNIGENHREFLKNAERAANLDYVNDQYNGYRNTIGFRFATDYRDSGSSTTKVEFYKYLSAGNLQPSSSDAGNSYHFRKVWLKETRLERDAPGEILQGYFSNFHRYDTVNGIVIEKGDDMEIDLDSFSTDVKTDYMALIYEVCSSTRQEGTSKVCIGYVMNEQTDFTIDGKLKFNLVYSVTGTLTWPNTFDDVHDVLYLSIYIINNFYSTLVNSHQPIDIQGADVSDLFDYDKVCEVI